MTTFIRSASWVADQGNTAWMDNDRRSVHAMLRGKGDDRAGVYMEFERIKRLENPSVTADEIAEAYETHVAEHAVRGSHTVAAAFLGRLTSWSVQRVISGVAFVWIGIKLASHL